MLIPIEASLMFEQKIFEELIILLHGGIICPEKRWMIIFLGNKKSNDQIVKQVQSIIPL